jgi:hypothetical protein
MANSGFYDQWDDHALNTEPRTVTHASDHWWKFEFATVFVGKKVIGAELKSLMNTAQFTDYTRNQKYLN